MRNIHCPTRLLLLTLLAACGSGGGESGGATGDSTRPIAGSVNDGLGNDIDLQTSTTTIQANWQGFLDAEGPIASYEWAIGTTVRGTQVQNWTSVGTATQATNSSLTLQLGVSYYVSVRAYDQAGNVSDESSSDGVQVTSGGGGGGGGPTNASLVSQWGITWYFSQSHRVGQFVNGDWWVVGPVTVTNITPQTGVVSGRVVNGSMINPNATGRNGYDSTLYHTYQNGDLVYDANLNVALSLPRVVPAGSSLISTVSNLNSSSGNVSQLQKAAVLTVLAAEPPAGSFRPAYAGTDKTVRFNENQLDYGALAQLQPAASAPTFGELEAAFEKVWLDHAASWLSAYIHPVENMPFYYREFTSLTGSAGLLLNCNYSHAQKRTLLIRLVQVGIDNFGVMQAGARWYANGHCNGRKFPILFAGRLLNDSAMLNAGITYATVYLGPFHPANVSGFSEDGQTFYVEETSPGVYNWGYGGYTSQNAGMPEWSMFHTDNCGGDNVSWTANPYRICCSANGWIGLTLVMRVMGLRSAWNHDSFFDYMDRYTQVESPSSWTFAWVPWQGTMWTTYRAQT